MVRQGNPLSPIIFNCLLEQIFRELISWQEKGVQINGKFLNNLRFANDIILLSDNLTQHRQIMLNELIKKGQTAGFEISKTKILSN